MLSTPEDSVYGCWVICDLNYINEFKDRTSNFPLVPLTRGVEDNELGYEKRSPNFPKIEKLLIDQNDKYEYPIHYRML